jgi:hypothetical protein
LISRLVSSGLAAAALALTATATLCPSQVVSDSNREVVGALPETVELVVGATDLTSLRSRPQTRALERFLNDASDWTRTTEAWTDLARKLDMSFEESIQTLLGRSAVIASESSTPPGLEPRFAVLSSIKSAVRRDLTRRLNTIPRSVTGDATVMSIEQGTYHLATRNLNSPAEQAQLILSSDASLFDRVVRSMGGRASGATLNQLPEWPQITSLADSDIFLLARKLPAHDTPGSYLALAGTPTPQGWTARFSASDSVIHGGVADVRSASAPWPSEAVDQLEAGSTLLVAGSPRAEAGKQPTLMASLLAMMNLPDQLRSQLEGAAIIALALPQPQHSGTSLVVALPLRDISAGVDVADSWAQSIVGIDPLDDAVTITDGVREASITPDNPAIINGYVRSEGRMAWCYAAAGGIIREKATPGWIVVALRFGPGEEPLAMVRRTASLLAHDEGKDKQTLFRLIVEPRQLSTWLAANPSNAQAATPPLPSGDTSLKVSQPAMRWLNRVDSRIVREAPGSVEGTVTLDLNLALLEVSAAAPATNKDQPTSPERQ